MVFKPSATCGALTGLLNGIVTGVPRTAGSESVTDRHENENHDETNEKLQIPRSDDKHREEQAIMKALRATYDECERANKNYTSQTAESHID